MKYNFKLSEGTIDLIFASKGIWYTLYKQRVANLSYANSITCYIELEL